MLVQAGNPHAGPTRTCAEKNTRPISAALCARTKRRKNLRRPGCVMFLPRCGVRSMPNARPTPGLRLTPEKYEQLRGLTEAVEHGTARFITYEAVLAARAFREIERLREGLEQLETARAEAERWRKKYEALRAG